MAIRTFQDVQTFVPIRNCHRYHSLMIMRSYFVFTALISLLAGIVGLAYSHIKWPDMRGLDAGLSKGEVVKLLRDQGVVHVLSVVGELLSTRLPQSEDFSRIIEARGVCIAIDGASLEAAFTPDGRIERLEASGVTKEAFGNFNASMSRSSFALAAKTLLSSTAGGTVFNCIPGMGWADLRSDESLLMLLKQDHWQTFWPGEYGGRTINFQNEQVVSIDTDTFVIPK